jgi:hypothetical protein
MPEIAVKYLKKCLELNQKDGSVWSNLGATYSILKDMDAARQCMEKAVEIMPDNPELHVNLANVYFLTGDYKKAWPEYEYRMEYITPAKYMLQFYDPQKQWTGEQDIKGKRLAVFSEQGAGDGILFSRFMRRLLGMGCTPIIHTVDEGLRELYAYNYCESTTEPVKEYDYYCSMLSLPYLLKIDDIPSESYITTNKPADLSAYKDFYKIGIVWAGNPRHSNDAMRSCRLSNFRRIGELQGVKLFCLQKDLRKRAYSFAPEPVDLAEGCDDMKVVDVKHFMDSFLDTAGLIQSLDLVISVDTSVLHLSGAVGKKTFGLIPYMPDWRWGISGEQSIWYKSMRLFRQDKPNQWDSVFAKVEDAVKQEMHQ